MPVLDLSDEELQGFVVLCATASGPGINWTLTNALLTKARLAQEANTAKMPPHEQQAQQDKLPLNANSQDRHAPLSRPT